MSHVYKYVLRQRQTVKARECQLRQRNVSKIVGGSDLELGVVSLAGVVRVHAVSEDGVQGQESSKLKERVHITSETKSKIVGGPDLELGVDALVGVVRVHAVSEHGVQGQERQPAVLTAVRLQQRLVQHAVLGLGQHTHGGQSLT